MRATFRPLPEDPAELRAVSELMAAEIKFQAYQIEKLKAELATYRMARFGSRSESRDQPAFDLSEDAEIEAAAEAQKAEPDASDLGVDAQTPIRCTHNRAPLADHLDLQDEVLSPGEICAGFGGALEQSGGQVGAAARISGIARTTLWEKMQKYGLSH